jgi:hypothetical protein
MPGVQLTVRSVIAATLVGDLTIKIDEMYWDSSYYFTITALSGPSSSSSL